MNTYPVNELTISFKNAGKQYRTDQATVALIAKYIESHDLAGIKTVMACGLALGRIIEIKSE